MVTNPYPGRFILFEGLNGAGKSTQIEIANSWASHFTAGPAPVLTKEPYTKTQDDRRVRLGDEIYQVLKGEHKRTRLADVTVEDFQRYFYFPNRVQHYLEVVLPALEKGTSVLSDRGLASVCFGAKSIGSLYHLMAEQLGMFEALQLPWPDAIIIYDLPPDVALQRMRESGKKLDGHETLETQERVRENYRVFSRNWPNCYLVDGTGEKELVFRERTLPIIDRVLNHERYQTAADHGVIV